ncbi:P27 family phage terminase small subunit, partial [Sporosarcina sp. NCCP-2331]|uniref:P27 family phage terminase small subunit n=1 Tax=Sporosarcina sp. NCCP-2331 TaxID=2934628 RepID=UPI00204192FB
MARPRKLSGASTGKIGKEEIEQRKKEEETLREFEKISLSPPSWLSKDAKKEYKRIVPLMEKLPIAALDLASVAMYCDYFSKYKAASLCVEV